RPSRERDGGAGRDPPRLRHARGRSRARRRSARRARPPLEPARRRSGRRRRRSDRLRIRGTRGVSRPLRIGVLKADAVLPDLAARHGEYPDMFRSVLQAADPSVDVVAYDGENGELPPALDACDGFVITGSRRSVYEDEPWIGALGEWVREAARGGAPLVGVCFGHQLVAQALAGRTEKAERGWTIGLQTYVLEAPLPFAHEDRTLRLIHSHQDQVTSLPPGARRLGGNAACPVG